MARLSLALLGPMQITLDGQPAGGFAYNKARALLAYLAVEAGRPHLRDTLAALLWPELPDEAARHNLRQALANLRTVLGDASTTPPFLLITRDTIQLNLRDSNSLDCSTFAALLRECEKHAHRHPERCRSCAARLEQAVSLYQGDFLAGFSVGDSAPFEEWLLRKRERLHQNALGALMRLAVFHERRGNHNQARACAQRQIELEPWREEAHRQLIRLLAHGGQRSSALAQYESCRRVLARDLGIEPEAATTALYEQIRDGGPRTEMRGPEADQTRHAQLPTASTPLIGRENDLAELGALLENPACRLITIVGPGGIGKTRLALAAAAEQAEIFTDGAAFVPLQPISSAAFLAPAILSALNIQPQGQREPHEHVLAYLRDKELLLVLDNFEHLLAPELSDGADGAALLADILRRAPGVAFLVTSRERLAMSADLRTRIAADPAGGTLHGLLKHSALALMQRPLLKALLLGDPTIVGKLAGGEHSSAAFAERMAGFAVYLALLRERGLLRTDLSPGQQLLVFSAIFAGFFLATPLLPPELRRPDDEVADLMALAARRALEPEREFTADELRELQESFLGYIDHATVRAEKRLREELG